MPAPNAPRTRTRRAAAILGSALFAAFVLFSAACVRGLSTPTPPLASPQPPPIVTRALGDVRVHALRTGWVSVKEAHRDHRGADATRIPAILADATWTEWMPVTVFAIEHPEGVWLVDAGLSEATLDPEHAACDAGNRFVYQNLLRFQFREEERVDRQLAALGIPIDRVRGVVLTHRHADHTDALEHLPASAAIYVGEGDWPTHNGALSCRWPAGRAPTLVGEDGPRFGAFPSSTALSREGRLRIVPLRGHSPGHLGVLLEAGGESALFAGDAVFSLDQLRARRIAGIAEVPDRARTTLDRIAAQLALAPTYLLPAHDAEALDRLARAEITRP